MAYGASVALGFLVPNIEYFEAQADTEEEARVLRRQHEARINQQGK